MPIFNRLFTLLSVTAFYACTTNLISPGDVKPRSVSNCNVQENIDFINEAPPSTESFDKINFEEPDPVAVFHSGDPKDLGHSPLGMTFDMGPKRRAILFEGTGKVDSIATSCTAEAQAFFNQGLGQTHLYWDYEAERSFREAAFRDPQCVMAYFGLALSQSMFGLGDLNRGSVYAQIAYSMIEGPYAKNFSVTPKERAYVESVYQRYRPDLDSPLKRKVAYIEKLRKLVKDYPEEVEAKALLTVALWVNGLDDVFCYSKDEIDQLLEEVVQRFPNHPAHHYRIHLRDGYGFGREDLSDDSVANSILKSAKALGPAAPKVAHAWHMPSHVYLAGDMIYDALWHAEASRRLENSLNIRVDPISGLAYQVMPYEYGNSSHHWTTYWLTLMKTGQPRKALEISKELLAMPRPPLTMGSGMSMASTGALNLARTLDLYELWETTIDLANDPLVERDIDVPSAIAFSRALIRAYIANFKLDEAFDEFFRISTWVKAGIQTHGVDEQTQAEQWLSQLAELEWLCRFHGVIKGWKEKEALDGLRASNITDPAELAVLALQINDKTTAKELLESYEERFSPWDIELPRLAQAAFVLFHLGESERAQKFLDRLEKFTILAEHDIPALVRLKPYRAKYLSSPREIELVEMQNRPSLDDFGSARWKPLEAYPFSFVPIGGQELVSLRALTKQSPVLLVFSLGSGCPLCRDQLRALTRRAKAFSEKGIKIVVVTVDENWSVESYMQQYETETGSPFPVTMISDPDLNLFEAYSVMNDFNPDPNKRAIHGIFLIDQQNFIRWQDLSARANLDLDFILKESVRLWNFPVHY